MSGKPIPAEPPGTPASGTPASGTSASRTAAPRPRRFKRRELKLAGGGMLVLSASGSIDRIDDDGQTVHSWALDDPEWPRWAIHFGLHDQDATITPQGRYVAGQRPPRW